MNGLFNTLFRGFCCVFLTFFISACGGFSSLSSVRSSIPDLITIEGPISAERAYETSESYKLLEVTEDMLAFTDPYVSRSMPKYQRAELLNTVLRGSAFLNIVYRVEDTFTSEQAFLNESANCVGYANLFIALARHYGLDAEYQLRQSFPQWNLEDAKGGPMAMLAIHINSVIGLDDGRSMVVDLAPRIVRQAGRTEVISDEKAKALFYNNLAMDELVNQNYVDAYGLMVRAILAEPNLDMLWINLGTIFRHNEQLNDAESAFKIAININSNSYSAMNNLAVLYQQKQDWPQFEFYLNKTKQHRQKNPYYHLQLAKIAEEEQDYLLAIAHLKVAIKLKRNEPMFHEILAKLNRLVASNTVDKPIKQRPLINKVNQPRLPTMQSYNAKL